jgi:hypothetical protein
MDAVLAPCKLAKKEIYKKCGQEFAQSNGGLISF